MVFVGQKHDLRLKICGDVPRLPCPAGFRHRGAAVGAPVGASSVVCAAVVTVVIVVVVNVVDATEVAVAAVDVFGAAVVSAVVGMFVDTAVVAV